MTALAKVKEIITPMTLNESFGKETAMKIYELPGNEQIEVLEHIRHYLRQMRNSDTDKI